MISKKIINIFIYRNYLAYLNGSSLFNINVLNFFNVTSIFYFEEVLVYLNLVSSNSIFN